MRNLLAICAFRPQFWVPQQLNFTIPIFNYLFVGFLNSPIFGAISSGKVS